jgi:hypothetical protein
MEYKFCDDHEWVGTSHQNCPECEELYTLEKPRCKICGLRGEHKLSCPARYTQYQHTKGE